MTTEYRGIHDLVGRIVRIDLTSGRITDESVDSSWYREFLGGHGLNQKILLHNPKPLNSPLDPETPLIIGAGLLVGTGAPGATRLSVDGKNLFSGGVGYANVGGGFASLLKASGIGHLILTGKAPAPTFLQVENGHISLQDAKDLWGKTVPEATVAIRTLFRDDASVLCIGPAAEHGARGACVIIDRGRAAAKCGLGTIMGCKNLKAIAAYGSHHTSVYDPTAFGEVCRRLWKQLRRSAFVREMGLKGTIGSAAKKNLVGGVPYRHYQDGFMNPRRINLIDSCSFQRYEQFRFGTRGCPITCRATYKIRKEDGTTLSGEAMQANTIQDFGYKLDIVDPAAIIQANLLCNAYGLDMDTCAESIAWAFECYEAGLINNRDTGGISLRWGNSSAVLQLITEIAYRVGFGDTLAEGSKIAAEILGRGSSELAVTMKGQDLYETMRSPKGYGLGAALSSRGGGHCSGSPISEFSPGRWSHSKSLQLYGVKTAFDPTSYDGKGQLVAFYEGFHTVLNSLGICFHATIWQHPDLLNWDDLSELVTTATGWNTEVDELMQIGERIHTIERLTNVNQAGITMSDDYPPSRFFCNPIRTGPFKGEKLDKAAYKDMLRENYSQHGWSDIGIPKQETLKALGIQGLGREESEASPIGVND